MNAQVIEAAPTVDPSSLDDNVLEQESSELSLSLQDFVSEFGDELLDSSIAPTHPSIAVRRVRTANWFWQA